MNMISAVTAKGRCGFAAFEGTTTVAVGGVTVHGRNQAMQAEPSRVLRIGQCRDTLALS